MEKEDQRNFLLAMVLMIALVLGYQKFFVDPAQKKYEAEQAAIEAETQAQTADTGVPAIDQLKPVEEALSDNPRIDFEGAGVDGSIRLAGARIDDVSLHDYYLTVERSRKSACSGRRTVSTAISPLITGLPAARWWRAATRPGPLFPVTS